MLVEAAVRRAESDHGGEVRFVIETDLSIGPVLRGCSARDRAIEVFCGHCDMGYRTEQWRFGVRPVGRSSGGDQSLTGVLTGG
jgi:hypothetical protein